jgi:hypothetical protein
MIASISPPKGKRMTLRSGLLEMRLLKKLSSKSENSTNPKSGTDSPGIKITKSQSGSLKTTKSPILNDILSKEKLRTFSHIKRMSIHKHKHNNQLNNKTKKSESKENHITQNVMLFETQQDFINDRAQRSRFIIHPDSAFKIIWDILSLFFVVYQCLMIPFRISFDYEPSDGLNYFEVIQDMFFLVDIILTFNTGFYNNGLIILTRWEIIMNYLKFWFFLDLAASIPYSMFISTDFYFNNSLEAMQNSQSNQKKNLFNLFKFTRLVRILRIVRLFKIKKFLRMFEEMDLGDMINLLIQILKVLFTIVFVAHIGNIKFTLKVPALGTS